MTSTNNSTNMADEVTNGETDTREAHCFEMIDVADINDHELNILKGDAIAGTIYSSKWIINTLISLSKVYTDGWTEEMENKLCTLWDMTMEKEVVKFLMDNDFLVIANFTLKISEHMRLTEIIVGIIGNMCCQEKLLVSIGKDKDLVADILNILTSNDSETLVQVMRILQSAIWNININPNSVWKENLTKCEFFNDCLLFILNSSTSDELLVITTNVIRMISDISLADGSNFLQKLFNMNELLSAINEAIRQIISRSDDVHSEQELKAIRNWIKLLKILTKPEFFSKSEGDSRNDQMMNILLHILRPYKKLDNLLLIEESIAECIYDCVNVTLWLRYNELINSPDIDLTILHIIFEITQGSSKVNRLDIISVTNNILMDLRQCLENYWMKALIICPRTEILDILNLCEPEVYKNTLEFVKANPKSSENNIELMLQVNPK